MDAGQVDLRSVDLRSAPTYGQAPTAGQVKKPRTPAQMAALEAARQKAFAIRAEKKKEKTLPVAAQEPVAEEPQEEVEYVRKGKAKPKTKKRIVVVEESSSED